MACLKNCFLLTGAGVLVSIFVTLLMLCHRTQQDSFSWNVASLQREEERARNHRIFDAIEEPVDPSLQHQGHSDIWLKRQASSALNKSDNSTMSCLEWTARAPKPLYFLTAVLLVRIYKTDKAKLTTKELKMWLQYLRYAGVEHVYVYDAWLHEDESQQKTLRAFERDGYITYIDWHTRNPYTIEGTQVAAYQHCIDNFSNETQWQAAIDIDEYPFSPKDTNPGFLYHYMKHISEFHREVSELTMQNYLFLGKPLDKQLLFERLLRRTHNPSNPLVKPIYKPNCVSAQVHHNNLHSGHSMNAPSAELRMNHYWGARLQNWGEDTPKILAETEPDDSIQPIVKAFKDCERHVRRYLR